MAGALFNLYTIRVNARITEPDIQSELRYCINSHFQLDMFYISLCVDKLHFSLSIGAVHKGPSWSLLEIRGPKRGLGEL